MKHSLFRTALAASALLSAALPQAAFAQGQWPVGAVKKGTKWTVSRVEEGCYVLRNDGNVDQMIMLAAGKMGGWDSVMFTDPRLGAIQSPDPVDAQLTLNGNTVTLVGTVISNFGDTSMPPMAITMFESPASKVFTGKPVAVSMTAKGLTLTGTIDPSAEDLANWRDCTKEMRSK